MVPASGQASDHHADGSQPVRRDPQSEKQQPTPAPSRIHPVSTQPNEESGKTVGQADTQKAIRVSEFPPVSINRDWIDCLAILFTGVLVGIGWFGVRAANKTLRAIERQTKATEDAAEATLKQANYMASSERAWLAIYSLNKEDTQILHPGSTYSGRNYWWKVRNVGRTPAKIVETQTVCKISQDDVVRLSDEPDFPSDAIPYRERMLAPGDEISFSTYWTGTDSHIFREEIKSSGDVSMVAYGYVRYLTTLDSDIHESRFCDYCDIPYSKPQPYMFRPKLDAPPLYTQHT